MKLHQRIIRRVKSLFQAEQFSTAHYWESRYRAGGTSGSGSVSQLAKYKAEFLNSFMRDHELSSATELGCGDGDQLAQFQFKSYIGLDIAPTAISWCQKRFQGDHAKRFAVYEPGMVGLSTYRSDVALSLDVLYHLVEDELFEAYLKDLFNLGSKYVIIYACDRDDDQLPPAAYHLKWRRFTPFIAQTFHDWKFVTNEPNPFPAEKFGHQDGSYASFFVFERR
jgi:hypothetical protein